MYTTNAYQLLAAHNANFGAASTVDLDSTGDKIDYLAPVPVVIRQIILGGHTGNLPANSPFENDC